MLEVVRGPRWVLTTATASIPPAMLGPDGCAYIADYGAVRDLGSDTHFVGAGNGPLVQIPGTGVIWKICRN